MKVSRSTHTAGAGMVGLLAITGGLIAGAAPAWAATTTLTVNNQTGVTIDAVYSTTHAETANIGPHEKVTKALWEEPEQTFIGGWSGGATLPNGGWFSFFGGQSGTSAIGCKVENRKPARADVRAAVRYTATLTGTAETGYTCTLAKAKKSGADVRVWSPNTWFVDGFARVPVVVNSTSTKKVREKIVVRDAATKKVIGKRTLWLAPDKAKRVKVAVNAETKTKLAEGKKIKAIATLKHADSTRGTGHRFKITIAERS